MLAGLLAQIFRCRSRRPRLPPLPPMGGAPLRYGVECGRPTLMTSASFRYGVECVSGQVRRLALKGNGVAGTLPTQIGLLTSVT